MTNLYNLETERDRRSVAPSPLKTGGGDGTSGGMEARLATLDAHVEHIRSDLSEVKTDMKELRKDTGEIRKEATSNFNKLLGAGFVALGIALGIMAKGFNWF